MVKTLETTLPEETFDPRCNVDLAEVMGYLMLLKEKGYNNDYRVGVVMGPIIGSFERFGVPWTKVEYIPGQVVIFKGSEKKSDTLLIGDLPDMYYESVMSNRNKTLNPVKPIDEVPKEYIREVI